MRFFSPFQPLLKGWLLSAFVWSVFALTLSWQIAYAMSVPWSHVFGMAARGCGMWALITPLVFRFVSRLPIERERWRLALPAHLVAGFAVLLAFEFLAPKPPPPPPPHARQAEMRTPRPAGPWPLGWLIMSPHMPIYLALLGAAHAFYFYRRSRERELRSVELDGRLAEARLQALQMQIQPHFLFNSLNALAALITKDPEAADEMLVNLSDFLRMTFESSGAAEVPLRRELEYVERYLAIERVRFGERLSFSIEAPADTRQAMVPTLLLQPLVENAVRHGIEPRSEVGRIVVRVAHEGETLRLTVSDNGVGVKLTPRIGVGLANTRERLRELYGEGGRLRLTSEVGTEVEICLPYRIMT